MPITKLIRILHEVKKELPSEDVKKVVELVENNEFGIAYETLCTQIYEYEVRITKKFYEMVSFYGESIKIQPSIWEPIKELIKCLIPFLIPVSNNSQ